jgi:PAS domain S-box-containing protein
MYKNMKNSKSEYTPSIGILGKSSIKKKLVLIIMLVSSVGLLLAGGSFITYEWFSLRKLMINDLNMHSEMIADNCTGSLSFDDPQDAEEVLGSLQYNHPIEYACVYRSDGALFASYKREDANTILSSEPQQDGCRFENGRLVLFKQITLNNKPIGTLYLQSDLSLISKFLKQSFRALAIMIFLSSIIAYFLSLRLQKVVSKPIFYLAKIASMITQKGDYSVRAKKYSKDELGVLTDAFNNMLIQVEKREISLRESRERFSLAVEGSSVGLWEWNVITGQEWWSERFRELIGYKSDELPATYESWQSLLHPDDIGKTIEAVRLHLETGKIYNIEYRLRNKNGDYRWFLARGVAAKDEEGHPARMSGSIQDVTERKRAEEALQSLATTFSAITGEEFFNKVSAHLATTLDMDYAFIGELIGKEDKVKVLGGFGKGQKLEPFEYDLADTPCENVMGQSLCCYPRGVSEQFPKDLLLVEMGIEGYIGAPLFDKSGNALGIMVVLSCMPITSPKISENLFNIFDGRVSAEIERKKAEEALRESEETALALLNATTDSVLLIDREGLIIGLNDNMAGSLGRASEDLIGTNVYAYLPVDIAEQRKTKGLEAASTRKPAHFEDQRGGRWLGNSVFPVYNSRGEVVRYAIYSRDITERKWAESELENYRKHLEVLVNERTQELEKVHVELVRKERLAALGELIATVSHEIRNPLGTIRNAVYSIGEAIGKNKMDFVNRALKLAESNITRCNRIINELLDFTRNREIKLKRTEIDSWLNGVLDEQEFPKNIECVRELHSGIVLPIDREYIRRAVNNVITNAIQALQEEDSRGNQLKVKSSVNGERLELSFIDTGPGIPDEIREKIFEPLFSTRSFGIGLGVPIIKNIMEEHQGEVKFQSEVDKGTIVTLILPIPKLEKKR